METSDVLPPAATNASKSLVVTDVVLAVLPSLKKIARNAPSKRRMMDSAVMELVLRRPPLPRAAARLVRGPLEGRGPPDVAKPSAFKLYLSLPNPIFCVVFFFFFFFFFF
jgi:hypothetical protein